MKINSYKNKKGETLYGFRIFLGYDPVTGKKYETKRQGFKTKTEAKNVASKLQIDFNQGKLGKNKSGVKTFQELFDLWFDSYKSTVKLSSAIDAKMNYKRYIGQYFGKLKIKKITVIYCQKIVNIWNKKYRKYRRLKNLTSQILNYAVTLEIIDSNPMRKIILPKPKTKKEKKNFYEKDELKHFFDCLNDIGDKRYIAFFRLLAYTGIRRGEAMGLKWTDFDFENKTLSIKRSLYFDEIDRRVLVQTPKTKSSVRMIDIDEKTVNILKVWRVDQQQRFLKIGINTFNKNQYVFTQDKSNRLLAPARADDWLKWIYKHYPQRKITIHGFRHTHASLLFEAGATIKEVQDRLGHSNSKTTLDIYTHVTKKAKHDAANRFVKFMEK